MAHTDGSVLLTDLVTLLRNVQPVMDSVGYMDGQSADMTLEIASHDGYKVGAVWYDSESESYWVDFKAYGELA